MMACRYFFSSPDRVFFPALADGEWLKSGRKVCHLGIVSIWSLVTRFCFLGFAIYLWLGSDRALDIFAFQGLGTEVSVHVYISLAVKHLGFLVNFFGACLCNAEDSTMP